jgi:CBS domain-containing protein
MARRISEMGKERRRVADVMIVDAIVVSVDATLEEADTIMRSTFVTGLPVVDGDGVLVGVIGHAQLAAHRFTRPMDSSDRGSAKSASAR